MMRGLDRSGNAIAKVIQIPNVNKGAALVKNCLFGSLQFDSMTLNWTKDVLSLSLKCNASFRCFSQTSTCKSGS